MKLEKLQDSIRGGLKTGSCSLTSHLNERDFQQKAFTTLSGHDFFKEMALSGSIAIEQDFQQEADNVKSNFKQLLQGVWRIVQTMVIGPLGRHKTNLAKELRESVPGFNFDLQLLEYELPTSNIDEGVTSILAILKTVFSEFATVSQVLALSSELQIQNMDDLKARLIAQP